MIEKYGVFPYGYSSSTSFESGTNSEDIKKASVLLIRKLYILMQNLGPLPNDVILTMKLHYYNAGRWRPLVKFLLNYRSNILYGERVSERGICCYTRKINLTSSIETHSFLGFLPFSFCSDST